LEPKTIYADALKKITLLYKMRHTVTENQVEVLDAMIKDYTVVCQTQLEIILTNLKNEFRKVENEQTA